VRPSGELDIQGAVALRAEIDGALDAGATAIVADLRDVTFIDSVSLAVLVAAKRKLEPDGRLALVTGDSYVGLIITAARLNTVLDVFPDREAAEAFAFN